MKHIMRTSAFLLFALTSLSACSSVRDLVGLDRTGPDEYAVSVADPLTIPPDFTLRPPQPGAPRPQEVRAEDKAKQALLGTAANAPADAVPASSAEEAVLANTKNYASRVPADTIKSGTIPQPEAMRILSGDSATPVPVADETTAAPADPESERLNKIANAPTTDGGTIQLEAKDKPFWDSWF